MSIPIHNGELILSKKKKIRILSVSKTEERELWTFDKDQSFIPSLLQFLIDLGFDLENDFDLKYFFGAPHENDEYLSEDYIKDPYSQKYLPIELFNQEILTFNKKNLDIEVIIFNNKIVLTIRSKLKSEEIGKLISKFAKFYGEND